MRSAKGSATSSRSCVGAIVGAGLLVLILGQAAGYDLASAVLARTAGAKAILAVWLRLRPSGRVSCDAYLHHRHSGRDQSNPSSEVAGLIIGLTLFALHLTFINVTGLSVNPARSLGPAVFVGGKAIAQLWLFLIVPDRRGRGGGMTVPQRFLPESSGDLPHSLRGGLTCSPLRRADAGRAPCSSGAPPARGCRSAWSRYPRGRAASAPRADRRRSAGGGSQTRAAAHAGSPVDAKARRRGQRFNSRAKCCRVRCPLSPKDGNSQRDLARPD